MKMKPGQAFLVGSIAGLCEKSNRDGLSIGKIEFHSNEQGDYENYFYIDRPEGRYKVIVLAPGQEEDVIQI
jgi:hypothetical protein